MLRLWVLITAQFLLYSQNTQFPQKLLFSRCSFQFVFNIIKSLSSPLSLLLLCFMSIFTGRWDWCWVWNVTSDNSRSQLSSTSETCPAHAFILTVSLLPLTSCCPFACWSCSTCFCSGSQHSTRHTPLHRSLAFSPLPLFSPAPQPPTAWLSALTRLTESEFTCHQVYVTDSGSLCGGMCVCVCVYLMMTWRNSCSFSSSCLTDSSKFPSLLTEPMKFKCSWNKQRRSDRETLQSPISTR